MESGRKVIFDPSRKPGDPDFLSDRGASRLERPGGQGRPGLIDLRDRIVGRRTFKRPRRVHEECLFLLPVSRIWRTLPRRKHVSFVGFNQSKLNQTTATNWTFSAPFSHTCLFPTGKMAELVLISFIWRGDLDCSRAMSIWSNLFRQSAIARVHFRRTSRVSFI